MNILQDSYPKANPLHQGGSKLLDQPWRLSKRTVYLIEKLGYGILDTPSFELALPCVAFPATLSIAEDDNLLTPEQVSQILIMARLLIDSNINQNKQSTRIKLKDKNKEKCFEVQHLIGYNFCLATIVLVLALLEPNHPSNQQNQTLETLIKTALLNKSNQTLDFTYHSYQSHSTDNGLDPQLKTSLLHDYLPQGVNKLLNFTNYNNPPFEVNFSSNKVSVDRQQINSPGWRLIVADWLGKSMLATTKKPKIKQNRKTISPTYIKAMLLTLLSLEDETLSYFSQSIKDFLNLRLKINNGGKSDQFELDNNHPVNKEALQQILSFFGDLEQATYSIYQTITI